MKKCIREKCEYWKDINELVSYCPLPRCVKVDGWIVDKKAGGGELCESVRTTKEIL